MELYSTPGNPSPPGAECLFVVTRDGLKLRALKAVPLAARGTAVIIGGRGDFFERYFETMQDLMDRGFAVASLDLRGQGGSQRLLKDIYRAPVKSFADFEEDIRAFMDDVVHSGLSAALCGAWPLDGRPCAAPGAPPQGLVPESRAGGAAGRRDLWPLATAGGSVAGQPGNSLRTWRMYIFRAS
jgi:hypothetical protein